LGIQIAGLESFLGDQGNILFSGGEVEL
jgi:hypothetical protein